MKIIKKSPCTYWLTGNKPYSALVIEGGGKIWSKVSNSASVLDIYTTTFRQQQEIRKKLEKIPDTELAFRNIDDGGVDKDVEMIDPVTAQFEDLSRFLAEASVFKLIVTSKTPEKVLEALKDYKRLRRLEKHIYIIS